MCICTVTGLDSLLKEVLDFCCPQSTIAGGIHFVKHQLVLGECHSQHTSIIVLQQTCKKGAYTVHRQALSASSTIRMSRAQTPDWELYHVLKLIKRNVSTVISIIVVKGVPKLCLRQPFLHS